MSESSARIVVWVSSRSRRSPPSTPRTPIRSLEVEPSWTVEADGATVVVRDVWTENEDHAAWLVASKVGLSPERVSVWAGRDS